MRKGKLIPLLLTTALLIAAVNSAIVLWSHRLPYRTKMEEIRTTVNPNFVVTGNSMMDSRVDAKQLQLLSAENGKELRVVNAALGDTKEQEQWLLFDYAIKQHPELRILVTGFNDVQLTGDFPTPPMELQGNHILSLDNRFPLAEVQAAYSYNDWEMLEIRLLRALPMAANRSNLWKYVELLRRRMSVIGMPEVKTTSFGRVQDFEAMEASSAAYFDKDVSAFNADPTHFNASYERIFAEAKEKHMKVVILLMPISERHRATYYQQPIWHEYLQKMNQLAASRGMQLVDASDWVNGEQYFEDPLHMSPSGAQIFTEKLYKELTK